MPHTFFVFNESSLDVTENDIIPLHADQGTSKQFHSEFKQT